MRASKYKREAVSVWQHASPRKPVYLATSQLKHRSRSYTTGIIELGLRSQELITHLATPHALSFSRPQPRPIVYSHSALTIVHNAWEFPSASKKIFSD